MTQGRTETQVEKDLLLINVLSAILILVIVLVPGSPLQVVLGVPFVLFFPGYTLVSALFPGRKDLGGIERLALSIGLSLAVVPLVGLALNYSPWGIRLASIMASLFMLTLLLSFVSNYRRSKLPTEQKLNVSIPIKMPRWSAMHKSDKLFIVGFLVGMVTVGGVAVYLVSAPKTGQKFTEFYMLGSNGQLADYPTNLTLGESGTVTLGVVNNENENATYRIVITLDNRTIGAFNNIALSNGATWQQNYTFTPAKTGDNMNLGFELYRGGLDTPYRSLQLWITVRSPQ